MTGTGKIFETYFRRSIPKEVYFYRFKDGTSSWDGGKARFQVKNIADCELFYNGKLFILELKSTKGKSLPYKNIRQSQIDELSRASEYKDIICGFVIDFSELNECYFIKISQFNEYKNKASRNSLPIDYLRENAVKIGVELIRKHKRYAVSDILGEE